MAIQDNQDFTNPESHCNQDHDHYTPPAEWGGSWGGGDWQALLQWSMGDHGFNEGADEAVSLLLQYGVGLPDVVANLGGQVAGNVWDRTNMMYFAISLAKTGNLEPATGLAIVSQWHNCHAFKCLLFHVFEIPGWLLQQ